jgi:hypothetical protein
VNTVCGGEGGSKPAGQLSTITFVAELVAPSVNPKISPVTVPATFPGGTAPVNENVKSSRAALRDLPFFRDPAVIMIDQLKEVHIDEPRPKRTAEHRAQAAVDELRLVLPVIIKAKATELVKAQEFQEAQEEHTKSASGDDKILAGIIIGIADNRAAAGLSSLEEYQKLASSLCGFDRPRSAVPFAQIWHEDAKILLDIYRLVIGKGVGISRNGPAVRFILSALSICGAPKTITGSAVAKALAPRKMKR